MVRGVSGLLFGYVGDMRHFFLSLLSLLVVLVMGAMAFASCTTVPGATGGAWPTATKVYSQELYAAADQVAARETAVAQETRSALQAVAKATSDALALEQQATRASQDAIATREARDAQATRTAYDAEMTRTAMDAQATATQDARNAMATADARNVTATSDARIAAQATANALATSVALTSTIRAAAANATTVAIQATATAVVKQGEDEETRQNINNVLRYGLVVLGLGALGYIGWRFLPVAVDRARVVRRRPDEGEPFILLERKANDESQRIALPLRSWSGLLDTGILPPLLPEWVNKAVMRQQTANLAQATQAGRIAQAKAWPRAKVPMAVVKRQAVVRPQPSNYLHDNGDQWKVEQPVKWPTRVPLSGILDGPPSVRDLILGVTVREDGQSEVVKANMGKLVHVAVGGSSGWGKSVFLRSLAFQLCQSVDPVDLALIDLERATFAPFSACDRLLYPVADTERDALAIYQDLLGEMDRRKALYADFPGVDTLARYNAQAENPLPPVVCMTDEATALLADKSVEGAIRTLVLRARKYGLWMILGGQDWKATSLDTAIRNQLATRVQFKAMSASQSRVLLQRNGAELLNVTGRALAIIPGREMIELQAPLVGYEDIVTATSNGGPRGTIPEGVPGGEDDQVARIRELAEGGLSKRQIGLEVFGYAGGKAHRMITEALQSCTTVPDLCTGAST